MKKVAILAFKEVEISNLHFIKGGETCTSGGAYFFGYGDSTDDCIRDDGGYTYWFSDGRSLRGDCPAEQ
jgi:hypothetical protein